MPNLGLNIRTKVLGFFPQPETIAYFAATTIPNDDTTYYVGTPYEITGNRMWVAVDKFVVSLKNSGIFSKLRYFYPFIGGTALDTKVNLIDPSLYQLTYLGGLTFGAQGVTPDGTSGVALTGFNLLNEIAGTNYFQGCYIVNDVIPTNNPEMAMGARLITDNLPQNQMYPRLNNSKNQIGLSVQLSNTNFSATVIDTLGHFYMERTSATDQISYKRNVLLQNNTNSNFLSHPDNEMSIFAQTYGASGTSPYIYYSTNIQSANYLGTGTLTLAQRNVLHTAIVTLQTKLFRNV